MRLLLLPAALLPLLLTAAAPGDAQKKNGVPEATPAGAAVDCLSMNQIRETRVRSDSVIDFITRDRKVYRNTLDGGCPQLGFEKRFMHKTSLNEYCSLDTITVLTGPGVQRGASCGLGKFQPVTLAPAAH